MQEMYYKLFEHSYCMYLSLTSIVLASALHPRVPLKKKKKIKLHQFSWQCGYVFFQVCHQSLHLFAMNKQLHII